jgi:hypothetical protein
MDWPDKFNEIDPCQSANFLASSFWRPKPCRRPAMKWQRIRKRAEDYIGSNLRDYEACPSTFSWARVRALLDGLHRHQLLCRLLEFLPLSRWPRVRQPPRFGRPIPGEMASHQNPTPGTAALFRRARLKPPPATPLQTSTMVPAVANALQRATAALSSLSGDRGRAFWSHTDCMNCLEHG